MLSISKKMSSYAEEAMDLESYNSGTNEGNTIFEEFIHDSFL